MLLQLDNTDPVALKKLLSFAKENSLKLSLIDEPEGSFFLPGQPLTSEQLEQLILKSRNSDSLSLQDAHKLIRTNYNPD